MTRQYKRPEAFTQTKRRWLRQVISSAIEAFVAMRRALLSLGSMMARVEAMEHRQAEDEARQLTVQARNDENQARSEERFDAIFKAMDDGDFPLQKVFYGVFLVVDDRELYLIGASLKDLGKKCFGFTKMDPAEIPGLKARL